jgi:virulence factor
MPPHHLFDIAIDVMNRHCHLFIEKPPGLTAYQNRQMALCAKRNKVLAMCGFQRRYVPLINTLRGRVEKRSPIHTVVVTFVKCSYPASGYYGGAIDILSCDAIHAVDTLRHLCGGDVVSVASDIRNLGADGPNAFYAIVKFSSGVTGILQTNWAYGRRFFTVEMHGQGISAYAEPDEGGKLYKDGGLEGELFDPAECAGSDKDWRRWGFYAESRHFIDCIRTGKQPCSNLADTVKTMELVDRIYHSQIA